MTGRRRGGHVLGDRGYIGLDRTGDQTNITGYRLRHAVRRADLPAVADTREILRVSLRQWGVPELVDTTELLATELLTNALQHTAGGAVLTATLLPGPAQRLRVEVRDSLARRPPPRLAQPPDEQGTSGRGLFLVEALADTWGVESQPPGKAVWFELAVPVREGN